MEQDERQILIKKCHVCGHIHWKEQEINRCTNCHKSFLPLNYFNKVHGRSRLDFQQLFCHCNELSEEDIVKGLYVLW